MDKLKRSAYLFVCLFVVTLMVSCNHDVNNGSGTDEVDNPIAGSISFESTEISKTTSDTTFINPLTKTGDGTVSYSSSDTNVATVDASTGEVTIVGAGTTTITATVTDSDTYIYETKTASYTLTITSPVTSISLNTTNVTLLPILGGASTEILVVSFLPENATENLTYSWESENSDIATVDDNGMVTGVSGGMTTITVKATGVNGELTATCTVIVNGIATPGRGATNYLTVSGASEANPVYFSGAYTGSANSESIPYSHGTSGSYDKLYFNGTEIYSGGWNVGSALIITGGNGTQDDPYILSRI